VSWSTTNATLERSANVSWAPCKPAIWPNDGLGATRTTETFLRLVAVLAEAFVTALTETFLVAGLLALVAWRFTAAAAGAEKAKAKHNEATNALICSVKRFKIVPNRLEWQTDLTLPSFHADGRECKQKSRARSTTCATFFILAK
jgi:hypothetical protein